MSHFVEVNEEGAIYLPPDLLGKAKPHTRYAVMVQGDTLILLPVDGPRPFWETATPEERAEAFLRWAKSHKDTPNIPDEALRRENMYD